MWSFLHFAANWLMQATGSPLTGEDICFPGNCCWHSQFPYVATGWKGRKGCGVLYSVRDRMAGSKMSAVFTRRQGVLQCFVASGAFCQQGIIQAVLLSSQGHERGSEIFCVFSYTVFQWLAGRLFSGTSVQYMCRTASSCCSAIVSMSRGWQFKPRDILDS